MALAENALPFGLRELVLTPRGLDGETPDDKVKLPAARTFSFSETEEFEELAGDDVIQASHGAGPVVEWDLEAGGLSLAAYQVMAGGSLATTGVTPASIKKFSKLRTASRPYFDVEGRAISDSGGDVHGLVWRCKADGSLEGELGNGAFFLTAASGKGYGNNDDDKLYDWIHNETATAIAMS